jgi:hypothetical protein
MRRLRIATLLCLPVVAMLFNAAEALDNKYLMYVGTFSGKVSEGIFAYRFDPDSGRLIPTSRLLKVVSPACLCFSPSDRPATL